MPTAPKNRRRSARLDLRIPVRIYGRTPDGRPFRDLTETQSVNAYGTRVCFSHLVTPGQSVLLVHGITEEEKECHIVYVKPEKKGKWQVGLEFVRPNGNFWQIFQPLQHADLEAKAHGAE
jgi:hypothetical protein